MILLKEKYLQLRKQNKFELKNSFVLKHILFDLALISLSFYFCKIGQGLQFLAIPLLAILMFRSFSFMHEAVHGLVSAHNFLNDSLGLFYGAFCGLPFAPWKKSHLEHHFWSGNYEKDPVMALITILPQFPKPALRLLTFLWRAWVPILALMQYGVFWALSLKSTLKMRSIQSILTLCIPVGLLVSICLFTSSSFIWGVFIPAVALYLLAVEVVNLPHHLQLPMINGEKKLPIWEQYQVARTCLYPKWVANFIVLNFNYHSEHHMFPDAPWYYLEKLHLALRIELAEAQTIDPSFKWILENRPKELLEVIQPNSNQKILIKAS